MEKPKNTVAAPSLTYEGDKPWWAGVKSFTFWSVGTEALTAAIIAVFSKEKKATLTFSSPVSLTLDGLFGAVMGMQAYKDAKLQRQQHDQLVADNIAMRQTLNETSQILRHVEGEVKKGHLADSQFTMKEAAPASHVARLEAEQAAHAVTDAAPQLR